MYVCIDVCTFVCVNVCVNVFIECVQTLRTHANKRVYEMAQNTRDILLLKWHTVFGVITEFKDAGYDSEIAEVGQWSPFACRGIMSIYTCTHTYVRTYTYMHTCI